MTISTVNQYGNDPKIGRKEHQNDGSLQKKARYGQRNNGLVVEIDRKLVPVMLVKVWGFEFKKLRKMSGYTAADLAWEFGAQLGHRAICTAQGVYQMEYRHAWVQRKYLNVLRRVVGPSEYQYMIQSIVNEREQRRRQEEERRRQREQRQEDERRAEEDRKRERDARRGVGR